MTHDISYDCRLSVSVRLTICLVKNGITDSIVWLRECVSHVLYPWNILDDRHLPVTWEWEIKDGEESLCMDLTCFHFDFSHAESENVNVAFRKLTWQLKQRLATACSHAEVTMTGIRTDCSQEVMAFFETFWDESHRVLHERVWDAESQKYLETPSQMSDFTDRKEMAFHCECCGKGHESGGYFANVHYQGRKNTWKKMLCEDCCILENSCRCDGCRDEFTESFSMERIDGNWYCETCLEEVKAEKAKMKIQRQTAVTDL